MPKALDLTGSVFDRLTVIGQAATRRRPAGQSVRFWRCQCQCGKVIEVNLGSLRNGASRSCGCKRADASREQGLRNVRHGEARNGKLTPEYQSWTGMIARCYDPKQSGYQRYGGRGIAVCERWRHSFEAFLEDMGRKPSPEHSVDRFPNNDGNYAPGNCRWATPTEQNRNSSQVVNITFAGETKCVAAWAESKGIKASTLKERLHAGWPLERAFSEPVRRRVRQRQ